MKELLYLTTHSTHFILQLYGVRHMVEDHSDSERGNPLPPHRLLFPVSSKGSFICIIEWKKSPKEREKVRNEERQRETGEGAKRETD